MIIKVSTYIPQEKFNVWYDLFKSSGGRFLSNPIMGKRILINYEFEDVHEANAFNAEYLRLTTEIKETKRSFIKKLLHKLFGKYLDKKV